MAASSCIGRSPTKAGLWEIFAEVDDEPLVERPNDWAS